MLKHDDYLLNKKNPVIFAVYFITLKLISMRSKTKKEKLHNLICNRHISTALCVILGIFNIFALQRPAEITADDSDGYYLKIGGPEYFDQGDLGGNFSQGVLGTSNQFTEKYTESVNVIYFLRCGVNFSTIMEIGFYGDQDTKFLITGYKEGEEMYVSDIEIGWPLISDRCGGGLSLYGRNESPYSTSNNYSAIKSSSSFIMDMYPEAGQKVTYKLSEPMKYVALLHLINPSAYYQIAAMEYIKIHFVKTPPSSTPKEPDMFLGNGEEDHVIDVQWTNAGISFPIKELLSYPDGSDNISDYDLNALNFYLTPDFELTEKPDVNSETIPEGMIEQEWYLYKILESQKDTYAYDGYIDSLDPIECSIDQSRKNLLLPAPCSGKYTLSVSSENINVVPSELTLNVWPNITDEYSWLKEHGVTSYLTSFSLNGIIFPGEEILSYPFDPIQTTQAYNSEAVEMIIPGLYNADVWFKFSNASSSYSVSSKLSETGEPEVDEEGFTRYQNSNLSLASLNSDQTTLDVELKINKNGAQTPKLLNNKSETSFTINLNDKKNTVVGVEEIGFDESEPVYYNLNGLRVDKNRILPGLYIRVTDKGAEKVLVR